MTEHADRKSTRLHFSNHKGRTCLADIELFLELKAKEWSWGLTSRKVSSEEVLLVRFECHGADSDLISLNPQDV